MRVLWCIIISSVIVEFGCSKKLPPFPKIEFEEKEFDFEEIAQQKEVSHIFKFRNTGGDTLVIEKVRAP